MKKLKCSQPLAVLLSLISIMNVKAETLTINNSSNCSTQTSYQILSSKNKIAIKNYQYTTKGVLVESGVLSGNQSKVISLTNNNGNVQIVVTQNMMKNRLETVEYFIPEKVFCTTYDDKKCFPLINGMSWGSFSVQQLCATSLTNASGKNDINMPNNLHNISNNDLEKNHVIGTIPSNGVEISKEDIKKGIANGTITVGGTMMKPIYESAIPK